MDNRHMQEAKELLRSSDILERVVKDMDTLGYVGERENKILGYLIALSRKLDEPLSGIIVSSSGAGKSRLVELIQRLTPEEDIVFTSKLTAQSLYYLPKDFLRHKLLIVEERIGSELADYAVRTLQSKGVLSLAVPLKGTTQFLEVKGPVSILETTSNYKLNLENTSRCFILHLDESVRQTELIHQYQRLIKTEQGIKLKQAQDKIKNLHQHMQRLIKSQKVIIPYANQLIFPCNLANLRREHQKFLNLIETVTLVYQYQRRVITKDGVYYIVSRPQDYKIALEVFEKTYRDNLFPGQSQVSSLLAKINRIDKTIFSRADIAKFTGWPDYKIRDNIKYLEEAGLLEIVSKTRGQRTLYKLNHQLNLTKPEELEV